jgi:hypothetical protein
MIFRGSRYENVRFTGILGRDGKVRKFLHAREPLKVEDMVEPILVHSFQRGEVIDEITWREVGKSRLWWVVADVSGVLFPLDIEPGTDLTVPIPELAARRDY